jgi:aspartate racemase
MQSSGWRTAGLLGTEWTMSGPVYADALRRRGLGRVVPDAARRAQIHRAIFEELCRGEFLAPTVEMFRQAIGELGAAGADCAILGCTEIPLIIHEGNSPLPVLDSTRLLARQAVVEAISGRSLHVEDGWIATGVAG